MDLALFFLDSGQKVRKVCKELDFSQKCYFKVSVWISSHTVCKIGLTAFNGSNYDNYLICKQLSYYFNKT
jgi:hypothetical protein